LQLASYPTFLDWHEQASSFDGLAYIRGTGLTYRIEDRAGLLLGAFVSEEFFTTLGVPAVHGRALLADDYRDGNVAVLSHRVWRTVFDADPGVIGRTVILGNSPFTVVGVMPSGFAYPVWVAVDTDLWAPITALPPADQAALKQRGFHADSRIIARLASGVPLGGAQAQMDAIARRLAAEYPGASARWTRVSIQPLTEFTVGGVRTRLFMLGGSVAVVLLICCVNLANLYLAQGAARRQEFAVRAALGAGRGRVVKQLLAESLVVALTGGALGTLTAVWVVHLVRVRAPPSLPRVAELAVDLRVLGFAAGLTILTAAIFAVVAARRAGSPHLAEALTDRANTASVRGSRGKLPGWLLSA
jgi:putative ABC transport system permease protein